MYYEMDKSNCRKREKLLVKVEKKFGEIGSRTYFRTKIKTLLINHLTHYLCFFKLVIFVLKTVEATKDI